MSLVFPRLSLWYYWVRDESFVCVALVEFRDRLTEGYREDVQVGDVRFIPNKILM